MVPCLHTRRTNAERRNHGCTKGWEKLGTSEVWTWCEQERRERDAPTEARHAEARQVGTWRQGEEPQAGDRHRSLRGAEEGREGATQAELQPQALIAESVVGLNSE